MTLSNTCYVKENKLTLNFGPYIANDVTFEELDELVKTWSDYKWALKMANVTEKYGGQAPEIDSTSVEDLIKWSKQEPDYV